MISGRPIRLLSAVLLAAILCVPSAVAQQTDDQDHGGNLVQFLPLAPRDAPLPAGATLIPWSEYRRLVLSGQAKQLAPQIIDAQRHGQATMDAANEQTISDYLTQHPDLTTLAQLFAAEPTPSDTVQPYAGNWQVTLNSGQQVVTMGRLFKLGGMADSIRASTDRATQLALYTSWYNQLPAGFFDLTTGTVPPTPASLADVPLSEIQNALGNLAGDWPAVASSAPIGPPLTFLNCNFEIGSSGVHGDYGGNTPPDPITRFPCNTNPQGIYANFDFLNKPYLGCVKNQSNRGTCHVFAVVSATEELIARNHAVQVNLSEQDLEEQWRLLWSPNYYDDGGYPDQEIQLIQSNNYFFPYEVRWDYNPSWYRKVLKDGTFQNSCKYYPSLAFPNLKEPCSDTSPQAPIVCSLQGGNQFCSLVDAGTTPGPYTITSGGISFWNAQNPDLSVAYILLNLAFNNGVVWGFGVTNAFMSGGNGGFIPYDANDLNTFVGGHAVHLVGYISNEDLLAKIPDAPPGSGGGYFIIKNSWGCWGDGGYGYVPVDYVKARTWDAEAVSGVN